ncbi:MAG: lipocalin family protein [Proteobacteria bacterium]|nr:lipocalin family protein [Pseudomonadota bacterium]
MLAAMDPRAFEALFRRWATSYGASVAATERVNDYSSAVVGHPGRDYLWILARTPTMAEASYRGLITRLQAQGYQTSRIVRTLQVAGPPPAGDSRSRERS